MSPTRWALGIACLALFGCGGDGLGAPPDGGSDAAPGVMDGGTDGSMPTDAATDGQADATMPLPPLEPGDPCDAVEACDDGRVCVEGICMLDPTGLGYVEDSFELLSPEPLGALFALAATDVSGGGRFFATAFGDALQDGAIEVGYGAVDADPDLEGGFVFQQHGDIGSFPMPFDVQRLQDDDHPDQGNAWRSEPFEYHLAATVQTPLGARRIRFDAERTRATFVLSDNRQRIAGGTLRGRLTRERAATLPLQIPCLLVCPAECGLATLETLLDALECNDIEPDVDADPDVEGNDAYRVEVAFTAERAPLGTR